MAHVTTCQPCAIREAGDTARAEAIKAIRAQRLLLAYLNSATLEVRLPPNSGGCSDCKGRLAATYLGMYAGMLV